VARASCVSVKADADTKVEVEKCDTNKAERGLGKYLEGVQELTGRLEGVAL